MRLQELREELEFKGLSNSMAENRTQKGRCYSMQNCSTDRAVLELGKRYTQIGARAGAHASDVGWGLGYGKFACNDTNRLTITGSPTGGTVKLSWQNPAGSNQIMAGTLPFNATATEVYDALQGLSNIDLGDITVTGGPWPTYPIDVTFKARYGRTDVNLIVLNTNSLTGGTAPTLNIQEKVKGGVQEVYLVAVQHNGDTTATLYKLTSSDSFATTTWTSIATGLTASNWFFIQYRDRVYAGNATDGLLYFQLGGSWSGPIGAPSFGNPVTAPTVALLGDTILDFTGATGGSYSGWGVNPTFSANTQGVNITLNAALTNAVVQMTITFAAAKDWTYQDYVELKLISSLADNSIDPTSIEVVLVNNDGSPADIPPVAVSEGDLTDSASLTISRRFLHWASKDRSLRDNILKIRLTMTVNKGTNAKTFFLGWTQKRTWPNDRLNSLNMARGATQRTIEYCYTFYQVSTDTESRLSAPGTSAQTPPFPKAGANQRVTLPGCAALTTSDKIRVYRRDQFGQWRRLGEVANVTAGTTTFDDTFMLDEVGAFEPYGVVQLPGGYNPEQLGIFKQCLVVGSDQKVWLSAVGKPLVFAYDPEDITASLPDESDADRPRTAFLSDNRADDVYAFIGQDSFYPISPLSSYAMVGDKPADLTVPRRLPGSRGCVGYRAAYALGGGGLIGSQDGLWYYSVGRGFNGEDNGALMDREESLEIRRSWETTLLGSSYSGLCIIEHQGEIWAFNGTKFLHNSRNLQWEEGTFADSVFAVHASRERGLVFIDTKGKLMKIGAYTTDNGATASWSYSTGILEGPRTKITDIEIQCQGSPRVMVQVYDGSIPLAPIVIDTPHPGAVHRHPIMIPPGFRYKITFSGSASDVVESAAFTYEAASKAKND